MNILLEASETSVFGLEPIVLVALMLVIGLVCLAAEVFIIPGFGIAGILGLLFLIGGSVAAWSFFGAFWGGVTVLVTVVLVIVFGVIFFRTKIVKKRLVLDTALSKGGGTESEDLSRFVGAKGVTRSDLRPAGIAVVDDTRLDVVSEGGFVDKGEEIKVVGIDGPRVVVAKLMETEKER